MTRHRRRRLVVSPLVTTTRSRRPGFTLIETVVTIGLIAAMAAFVVPSVMNQAGSANPVKAANDLNSIGVAVQSFASDLKGVIPGDLEDLITLPIASTQCGAGVVCDSTVTHAAGYTVDQVQLWKGPYLAASISDDPRAVLRSGYIANVENRLLRFDATSGVPEFCSSPGRTLELCSGFVSTDPMYVAVKVDSLTAAQAGIVNDLVDGPKERFPGLEGRFRYPTEGSPAYYLAAPIVP
jgi:prepilin-type N-terminal cleavage/methylation domain-containing protein